MRGARDPLPGDDQRRLPRRDGARRRDPDGDDLRPQRRRRQPPPGRVHRAGGARPRRRRARRRARAAAPDDRPAGPRRARRGAGPGAGGARRRGRGRPDRGARARAGGAGPGGDRRPRAARAARAPSTRTCTSTTRAAHHWEGFATGTAALVAGGATTAVDMPLNSVPPTVDGPGFEAKLAAAAGRAHTDFGLWGGCVPGNAGELAGLAARGVVGFKAFMSPTGVDEFRACDPDDLHAGMAAAAPLGLPVAVHAEDPELTTRLAAQAAAEGRLGMRDFLASRPVEAEVMAVARAIAIAEETGCALHVVHISSGRAVALVAEARARGADVTCEVCAHHLVLTDEDAERIGLLAKCAPPLRPGAECERLWGRLGAGEIAWAGLRPLARRAGAAHGRRAARLGRDRGGPVHARAADHPWPSRARARPRRARVAVGRRGRAATAARRQGRAGGRCRRRPRAGRPECRAHARGARAPVPSPGQPVRGARAARAGGADDPARPDRLRGRRDRRRSPRPARHAGAGRWVERAPPELRPAVGRGGSQPG